MNYKKITKISFVAVMTLAIAFPSVSLAVGNFGSQNQNSTSKETIQNIKADIKEQKTEQNCNTLINRAQQIQNRLTERISNLTQKRNSVESNIQSRVEKRTTQRTERRASWQEKKEIVWDKLEAKAETDEQKAAITKFIETVQTAVKNKNDAIDSIITELRATIQTRNNERKRQIDSQIEDYKDTIASVVAQVKSDCEAGKDISEVRANYKTQMQQAREKFQNREKNAEEFKAGLSLLKETKKAEMQEVLETFRQTIEEAKAELLESFSNSTENDTVENKINEE